MQKYIYNLMTDRDSGKLIDRVMKFMLSILSYLYVAGLEIVIFCYKFGILASYQPGYKVVSVGNITLGGTGKTPFVEGFVRNLQKSRMRVVILERGYGGGDEVEVLMENLADVPILVGRDRIRNAKIAEERYNPDVIVLDDGFQHWRLKRDLDIVLINGANPFGNGSCLPRGILREPLSHLKRADIFVITKKSLSNDDTECLKKINPCAKIIEAKSTPLYLYNIKDKNTRIDLKEIKGKPIHSFCGIADPSSFEESLRELGADLKSSHRFSDHYRYTSEDIEKIAGFAVSNGIESLVTTQKDAVKVAEFLPRPKCEILALRIALEIPSDFYKVCKARLCI